MPEFKTLATQLHDDLLSVYKQEHSVAANVLASSDIIGIQGDAWRTYNNTRPYMEIVSYWESLS